PGLQRRLPPPPPAAPSMPPTAEASSATQALAGVDLCHPLPPLAPDRPRLSQNRPFWPPTRFWLSLSWFESRPGSFFHERVRGRGVGQRAAPPGAPAPGY